MRVDGWIHMSWIKDSYKNKPYHFVDQIHQLDSSIEINQSVKNVYVYMDQNCKRSIYINKI